MRQFIKKTIAHLLTIFLLAALCGCGDVSDAPAASKEGIFSAERLTIGDDDFDSFTHMVWDGEALIIFGMKTDRPGGDTDYDSYIYHQFLLRVAPDGTLLGQVEIMNTTAGDTNCAAICTSPAGTIYALLQRYTSGSYTLVSIDSDLNMKEIAQVGEALASSMTANLQGVFVYGMAADAHGNVYIQSNQTVIGINTSSGETVFETSEIDASRYMRGVTTLPDGNVGICYSKETENGGAYVMRPVTADSEDEIFPANGSYPIYAGEGDYQYYSFYKTMIHGFDRGDETNTVVGDLVASGLSNLNITNYDARTLVYIAPDTFACHAADTDNGRFGVYILKKTPPEDVPDKKVVKVALIGFDMTVEDYAQKFNRASEDYRAELAVYTENGSDPTSWAGGFNEDIIKGNIPDVLLVSSYTNDTPYYSYIKKGMFADLYPLMKADKDFDRDDLTESFVKALETGGKLYSLPWQCQIRALVGKSEIFGDKPGLTLAQLTEKASVYPDAQLFNFSTRYTFLLRYILYVLPYFVDMENGTCSFDSPEFIEILKFAETLPDTYSGDGGISYPFRDNEMLVNMWYFRQFSDISAMEQTEFCSPVTVLGYPNNKGVSGITAATSLEFAIMENSANKAGAWAFVKGVLDYDGLPKYGTAVMSGGEYFYMKKSRNDILAAEAKEPPYTYQQGEKKFFENSMNPRNTDENNAQVFEMIDNVSTIYREDTHITEIIESDLANFYAGKKSAEDTAALIQNRVSTYLAEMG
jgi:ABC-type glycerol-3-phosphate transport system substrate-binding protein